MASSGNFCTLNQMTQPNSGVFSEGDLLFTHTASAWRSTLGTFGMTTGKWYWEAYQYENLGGNGFPCGIYDTDSGLFKNQAGDYLGQASSTYGANYVCYTNSGTNAEKRYNGSNTNLSFSIGTAGDVWQCAFDADNGKIWFGKNNTWDNSGNPATGTGESYSSIASSTWSPVTCSYNDSNSENYPQNFGQNGSFGGRITDEGNADGNGHGSFKYSPPSGFLSLCAANLPISSDIDPATTDTDNPTKQFGAETFTGNGGTQTIQLGDGFQPDLVVLKNTGSTNSYIWLDSSRGYNKTLKSDDNSAEGTDSYVGYGIESNFFGSTGIVANDGGSPGFNNSTANYVVYGWRANGGTTSTNTSGTITTTVQANQAAGFSILTYTGTGSNATIGHGLSQKPNFILFKRRSGTGENWNVYHSYVGATKYLLLNSYGAMSTSSTRFQDTDPTSTVITLGNESAVNTSTGTHVAYVWHDVEGFSKYGGYEGSNADNGPFIYTGFRPRMVWIKNCDTDAEWCSFDTARNLHNPMTKIMQLDENYEERGRALGTNQSAEIELLANGFKCMENGSRINTSHTFIYMAWADVPYKYGNTHNQYSS